MLAMPAIKDIPVATVMSLVETVQLCERLRIELVVGTMEGCSMGAFDARNLLAHEFLKSKCSHIFWVDADMTWRAEDFVRLVESGQPFVAAVGPKKRDKPTFAIYENGVGLAFACIERRVMESIAVISPSAKRRGEMVRQIFRCEVRDGLLFGEDMQFCSDIAALGYEIKKDLTIALGHIGTKEYNFGAPG